MKTLLKIKNNSFFLLLGFLTMFLVGCQSKMSDGEIIRNMSTEKLVQACLNSPEWALIIIYNRPMDGYANMLTNNIEFQELLFSRDDAFSELLKEYEKNDPLDIGSDWTDLQKGLYAFQFNKIEYLFTSLIQKSDIDDLRQLKEQIIAKYRKKKIMTTVYSVYDLSPSVFLCLRIIKKVNSDILERNDDINHFMMSIVPRSNNMIDAMLFLDSIVELFENLEL